MENKKEIIISVSLIIALLILIIIARVSLKLSRVFFLIAGADISLIFAVISFLLIRIRYNKRRKLLESKLVTQGRELRLEYSFLRKVAGVPTKFRYKDLEEATDNFRSLLGKGASGSVFKGILSDGTQVAVKRIEREEKQDREFRSEVAATASVQHKNLVRLLGYCSVSSPGFKLLVYDFIPNGSLDIWIFPGRKNCKFPGGGGCLSWHLRYRVAIDVAKALAYLHHDCRSKILHLDVKPENILLDENYIAMMTDFGVSKLMGQNESRVITDIRGTRGYLAPEWFVEHGISEKTDVYSYGMVLLEMIGGRKNMRRIETGNDRSKRKKKWQYFHRIVNEKMREGKIMEVVDQRLVEAGGIDEGLVMRMVYVAMWCIQERPKLRPSMVNVVEMLEGRMPVNEPPDTDTTVVDFLSVDEDETDGINPTRNINLQLEVRRERKFRVPSLCSCSMSSISPR